MEASEKPFDALTAATLRREVERRGVAAVARILEVPRSTLTSVMAGTARDGSQVLVALRVRERLTEAA